MLKVSIVMLLIGSLFLLYLPLLIQAQVNIEYFTGEPNNPAWTCGDVLNKKLAKGEIIASGEKVPATLKRRFIDGGSYYTANCIFDVTTKTSWTEIYTINAPDYESSDGYYSVDGAFWQSVSPASTSHVSISTAYTEVPFRLIKLLFQNGRSNLGQAFSLSAEAFNTATNPDWKIISLYHIYNRKTSGRPIYNIQIISAADWENLGVDIDYNLLCTDNTNKFAGFRFRKSIVNTGKSQYISALFGFQQNIKKDGTTNGACGTNIGGYYLIGTGLDTGQKILQGFAGPNIVTSVKGSLLVSEGPLDCSEKNYCSLRGRCISSASYDDTNGVCDCVRDYSGDNSCKLPIYSGQDMLIYLKQGNSFKSLTNTFHAMIEDNTVYSDNNGFSFLIKTENGINLPHLSFGTYSEPFPLRDEFTIAFEVKFNVSGSINYALTYSYVESNGNSSPQLALYFIKSGSTHAFAFCLGGLDTDDTQCDKTKTFGQDIFTTDFKWIIFSRGVDGVASLYVRTAQSEKKSSTFKTYKILSPGFLVVGTKSQTEYDNFHSFGLNGNIRNFMVFDRSLSYNEVEYLISGKNIFCFRLLSNDSRVCNGLAVCTDYNICNCPSPFQGQNCELFKGGTVTSNNGDKNIYGVIGSPTTLTLNYTYPLLNDSLDVLKGKFYCLLSGQKFEVSFEPGSTIFNCTVALTSGYVNYNPGWPIHLYYQSDELRQVSSFTDVTFYAITNDIPLHLNYYYWFPNNAINGLQVSTDTDRPIYASTKIKVQEQYYSQISKANNFTFNYEAIPSIVNGNIATLSRNITVKLIVAEMEVASTNLYVFGIVAAQYELNSLNALRVNTNTSIVLSLGSDYLFESMRTMLYCGFVTISDTYYGLYYNSTTNKYTCTVQSPNIGVNRLQIFAKGDNGIYQAIGTNPSKPFYIYKKENISYTEHLIFLTTESTPSFTIRLSQYSITIQPGFDFRSQIKCLVSGSTIPSTPIVSDSNSVTAVTCQPSISQEGTFNLNVVHDYNPGYLLLSDSNIKFYTFSPRNLSPSKFAKLIYTPGDVIVNVVGNGLPYNTDTTAFNYRIVMNSDIIIPSTLQVNGGLVTQFTITFPSYSTEFYNTDVKLQVVKGTDVIDLSTMQLSIISPKIISLIENDYVTIGSNSTLQFALNDTIIPQSVIEGFLCEFNSTYHFPVKFTNNILSCDVSNTGTLPGIYTLRLVSGDLTSRISVNDLNIYALGGLYNINYYTPSVFPQSQSYFVKVATNDQSNSFFNLDSTTFKYYLQTSISKETFPVDLTKLSDESITLSSSFKLPGSQTFSLLLSYQGMNFTLNTFDIYFLNTLPLRLHSSSDIAELINNNANIKLETTSYTLQQMSNRFVKCKNEGNYVLSNADDYPTIITCSFMFTSFGFKTISLVYDDSLNAMFDISTSIDFPIIDPKIAQYSVGTHNIGLTNGSLTTAIVTNTWLPNYLQNNVMCIANPTLSVYPSVKSTQEFSCISTTNTFGDYYLSLVLKVNTNTGKTINLISNSLPIQFVISYNTDLFTMVQPGIALIGRPIQPILYTNQDIPFNTTVLDYKCGLFYSSSGAPFTSSIALKNSSANTFVCDPLIVNEPSNNYYITLFVSSRWNPTNNYGLLYSTITKMIHFTTRRNLELHNSSPVALSGNTKLKATFINNWTIPSNVIADIKFVIGSNNFSPTSFGSDSISLENGPTLSRGYMQIELWFKSNVSSSFDFALSTNAFQFPFVEQQTVSFNTSFVNGAYVNQLFTSKLRYNGFLGLNSPLSSVAPSLHNRVYCSIGATFVKASRYDYISENISEFECPLQYSTKGVISGVPME
ncbi:hypothetical protein ABK040_002870 [Willaertia magna]